MVLEGEGASIIFPNLGITIQNLSKSFTVFGYKIAWYGVIIACGMIIAVLLSMLLAKRTNQDVDDYIDVAIWSIIFGLIGARAYYVIFSWEEYKDNLIQVFNIRAGGLAIYGGLIGGIIAAVVVCKIKKISVLRVLDTAAPTIAIAQAIGRWGNFMNMEAYGGYTDNLFAMQLNYDQASGVITDELIEKMVTVDDVSYIQVHPTFLYECMWCLVVAILILIFKRFQRYNGELILWYIGGYALGRAWIEGLRTDQLLIGNSGIAISQILSVAIVAGALTLLIINRIRLATKQWVPSFSLVLEAGQPGTVEFTQSKADERKARKAAKKGKDTPEENEDAAEGSEEKEADKEAAEGEEIKAEEGEENKAAETAEGEAAETAEGENTADEEAPDAELQDKESDAQADEPKAEDTPEETEEAEDTPEAEEETAKAQESSEEA